MSGRSALETVACLADKLRPASLSRPVDLIVANAVPVHASTTLSFSLTLRPLAAHARTGPRSLADLNRLPPLLRLLIFHTLFGPSPTPLFPPSLPGPMPNWRALPLFTPHSFVLDLLYPILRYRLSIAFKGFPIHHNEYNFFSSARRRCAREHVGGSFQDLREDAERERSNKAVEGERFSPQIQRLCSSLIIASRLITYLPLSSTSFSPLPLTASHHVCRRRDIRLCEWCAQGSTCGKANARSSPIRPPISVNCLT